MTRNRTLRGLPWLLPVIAGCSGNDGSLVIVSQAPIAVEAGRTFSYQPALQSLSGAPSFALIGPSAMTVSSGGLIEWSPTFDDIGSYNVNLTVTDESGAQAVETWVLRVHQGIDMGVALSPARHPTASTDADFDEFYSNTAHGRLVAFHGSWRDSLQNAGRVPTLALAAVAAAQTYGSTPVVGFGWSDGDGNPDLLSESDQINNSWANQETRAEFLQMVTRFARDNQPPYLFLGNETNSYFVTHTQQEWDDWISEFEACYDAIKTASPNTVVYTTFQFEKMKGLGVNNGWSFTPHFELIADHAQSGKIDAIAFTSYPYFEFGTPGEIPDSHYTDISAHWTGPVGFSEIGWLAAPSGPYPGSEDQQSEFLAEFIQKTRDVNLDFVLWLFLHDAIDQQPAFTGIGLRDNTGTTIRAVDAFWRDAVQQRQQ